MLEVTAPVLGGAHVLIPVVSAMTFGLAAPGGSDLAPTSTPAAHYIAADGASNLRTDAQVALGPATTDGARACRIRRLRPRGDEHAGGVLHCRRRCLKLAHGCADGARACHITTPSQKQPLTITCDQLTRFLMLSSPGLKPQQQPATPAHVNY